MGEDSDLEIYFDKYTLMEHLSHMQEDNLFKIHLVQEEEQALEKYKKDIEVKIKRKEREVKEVQRNSDILQ